MKVYFLGKYFLELGTGRCVLSKIIPTAGKRFRSKGLLTMSDAELRRQNRYTWMLGVFTAVVMIFMLKQSRAAAEAHAEKFGGTLTAGLMIETGSHLR